MSSNRTKNVPRGYHVTNIPRGKYGEISKIVEETLELQDADAQGAKIMVLTELADLMGAINGYLSKHHPSVTMADLHLMAGLTARAFEVGHRESKETS